MCMWWCHCLMYARKMLYHWAQTQGPTHTNMGLLWRSFSDIVKAPSQFTWETYHGWFWLTKIHILKEPYPWGIEILDIEEERNMSKQLEWSSSWTFLSNSLLMPLIPSHLNMFSKLLRTFCEFLSSTLQNILLPRSEAAKRDIFEFTLACLCTWGSRFWSEDSLAHLLFKNPRV